MKTRFANRLKPLSRNASGATAIEYALIAAFLSIGIVIVVSSIGDQLVQFFTDVSNGF